MQSKDLRIGNLVKGNSRGGTHVLDIEILKYIDETKSGYSPIPLTEECLEKLGFYLIENDNKFYHEKSTRIFIDINNPICITYNNAKGSVKIIEYVHELQNLYFALTGEELELKHESKP
jgi:hypothetical protein